MNVTKFSGLENRVPSPFFSGTGKSGSVPIFSSMKKAKVLIGIFFMVTSFSSYAGESAEDTTMAQQIRISVVEPVLIAHSICVNTNDCISRSLMRYSVAGHISWRVYSLSSREVIDEIFSKLLVVTKGLPRNKTYAVYVYSEKEQDAGFFAKPIAQLIIQGDK